MYKYICPKSKLPLSRDVKGNLWCSNGKNDFFYKNHNGSIDFIGTSYNEEFSYYKNIYRGESEKPNFGNLEEYWNGHVWPHNKLLLDSLSNLDNKVILLLGNGVSEKEFHFLNLGAYLIYSDASLEAVQFVKCAFEESELFKKYKKRVVFHAIDALNIPLPEESVDIVYAYALVHHIDNLSEFFCEINRVLKKNGKAIFLDDGYSPVWQFMKKNILKPLQNYSHKKHGISPEDLRATHEGGIRREVVEKQLKKYNLEIFLFSKVSFFLYLWRRAFEKLFRNKKLLFCGIPVFKRIDTFFARKSKIFKENQIRLVWGIRKRS